MKDRSMPYRVMKVIVGLALGIFFRSIQARHAKNIPDDGPVVFVANHPTSIMDALVLGAVIPRQVNYIAHSGLFKHRPFRWFLRRCGVIPVHRREDKPAEVDKNVQTFQACYEVLEQGGVIGIFPEGTSHMDRQVRRLKTGAARIALETEARNAFRLGVKIIPVGLHFFSRSHFRSNVLVNVGEPITLEGYAQPYRQDPYQTVRDLTAHMQRRLEDLTVNVRNLELAQFIRDVESIYHDELKSRDPQGLPPAKALVEDFIISQKIAECVEYYQEKEPWRVAAMQETIDRYKRKLRRLHLRDSLLKENVQSLSVLRTSLRTAGLAALGFPLAAYGMVNNYIPYKIAGLCARHFVYERTKILSALLIGGGLAFLFFYALQTIAVGYYFGLLWAGLYGLSLPFSGFFALGWLQRLRENREKISLAFFLFRSKHLVIKMKRERRKLIEKLNAVKEEYLAEMTTRVARERAH